LLGFGMKNEAGVEGAVAYLTSALTHLQKVTHTQTHTQARTGISYFLFTATDSDTQVGWARTAYIHRI
jgi:hypothetical protein